MSKGEIETISDIGLGIAGAIVVVFNARWGEYLGEPANIVSLVVSVVIVGMSITKTIHYLLGIRETEERRRRSKHKPKPKP